MIVYRSQKYSIKILKLRSGNYFTLCSIAKFYHSLLQPMCAGFHRN